MYLSCVWIFLQPDATHIEKKRLGTNVSRAEGRASAASVTGTAYDGSDGRAAALTHHSHDQTSFFHCKVVLIIHTSHTHTSAWVSPDSSRMLVGATVSFLGYSGFSNSRLQILQTQQRGAESFIHL